MESTSNWRKSPHSSSIWKGYEFYSQFRERNQNDDSVDDKIAFRNWLIEKHGFQQGAANCYLYPLRPNQLDIASLNNEQVDYLAHDPQGRIARIFLYRWYRCNLQGEFPRCLADVFIVGWLRQQGPQGQALKNEIVEFGYANPGPSVDNLIAVGRGIGQHFGFLKNDGLPTAFFNSFFQDTY